MTLKKRFLYGYSLLLLLPLALAAVLSITYATHSVETNTSDDLTFLTSSLRSITKTSSTASIRNNLKIIAEKNLEILHGLYNQYQSGIISLDEAKWLAGEMLLSQTIATDGHLFVTDSLGSILVQPLSKKTNLAVVQQAQGQKPSIEKKNYSIYSPSTDGTIVSDIAVYNVYFEPWDWFIFAACPSESFDQQQRINLSNILKNIHLGKDRTIFIIARDGHVQQFPPLATNSPSLEQGEFIPLLNTIRARKTDHINYKTTSKNGGKDIEKTAYFEYLPKQDLIVGISVIDVDLFRGYGSIIRSLAPSLLVVALLSLTFAFFLSQRLCRPLSSFIDNANLAIKENRNIILTGNKDAELASLAATINRLQGSKRDTQEQLNGEIDLTKRMHKQLDLESSTRQEALSKLHTEIATRKSAENYLLLFKNIFDNAIEGIFITDAEFQILAVNQAFSEITGYAVHEAVGHNPKMLNSGKQDKDFYTEMWQTIENKGSWSGEIWNRRKDGAICPEWLSISKIKNESGTTTNYFAFFHDISELKKRESQITFMAYRDALTKLPNRAALEIRMDKAISHAKRKKSAIAVYFIDLDNFKKINDSLGHHLGDKVLIQASKRISETIRTEDTLSRLGGDEFILLSEHIESESEIYSLAGRLLKAFKRPLKVDLRKIYINASIGISVFPSDGSTTQDLIKNADLAMYKAKSEGRNQFVMFTQKMHEKLLSHIRIENAIRTGLRKKEFLVYYQPKIDISNERTTSFEALIRWNQNGTIIPPGQFIPIAEESGLIDEMSLYVVEEVCKFLDTLRTATIKLPPVSVNMSPRTFNNLEIVETIDQILDKHGIDHKYIEFEVTETTAMHDVQHTLDTMNRFRQRGIRFSIDDFGTGYSSLSYLNEMPVSTLKIDKRFISAEDDHSKSIVSTIIAMSKQMELKVVAEGAETEQQLRWLQQLGCHEVQGYYYSRPMPEATTIDYLLERHDRLQFPN